MNKWIRKEKNGYLLMSLLIVLIFAQLYYFTGSSQLVFKNVFLYFFKGVPFFDEGTSFLMEFPWYWFGIQIFLFYRIALNLDFTHNRIEQFLVREKRKDFYKRQVQQILFLNISYFLLVLFLILLLGILFKIPFYGDHLEIDYLFNKIPLEVSRTVPMLILSSMSLLVTNITLSLALLVFYIILNGVGAFLLVMVYYILSFFIANPLFLSNFVMLGRTLQRQYGVTPESGMILGIVVFIILYKVGLRALESKDILQDRI